VTVSSKVTVCMVNSQTSGCLRYEFRSLYCRSYGIADPDLSQHTNFSSTLAGEGKGMGNGKGDGN